MSLPQNSVATDIAEKTLKLHDFIFTKVYQCPLQIKIKTHQIAVKLDHLFQRKYIPFLFFSVLLTSIILPFSCILLLIAKLYLQKSFQVGVVQTVALMFVGSCTLCQLGDFLSYFKFTGIEVVINQVFVIERKCKLTFTNKLLAN